MPLTPQSAELDTRLAVTKNVIEAIEKGLTIYLPEFDPKSSRASDTVAFLSVGIEPNPYGGTVGEYRYQFEGEEDLLHLVITRLDLGSVAVEEAQSVASFLWPGIPSALVWYKPGDQSHHFYIGHDVLLEFRDQLI